MFHARKVKSHGSSHFSLAALLCSIETNSSNSTPSFTHLSLFSTMSDERYGPIALREDAVSNTQVPANDEDDEEEAHEFATYVESDDDDEDPYFMPEHNRKSSTLSFSR